MNLLILGGTVFLGRALVDAAVARGHTVTLFNRGKSNPGLFPQVETLVGDRDSDLAPLIGRSWDAAIDTSGYVPRLVRKSAALLKNHINHYTFISSLSVYADFSQPYIMETAAVGTLPDGAVEVVDGDTYGPLKALCEQAVLDVYGEEALVLRPGLIVGPYDPTDRFTYWPHRVEQAGDVLVPGRPERPIQFIDVRDLAEWNIRLIENGQGGVFNAVTPPGSITMGDLLESCCRLSVSTTRLTWVPDDFLAKNGAQGWIELPLWMPEFETESKGFFLFDVQNAVEHALTFRPLDDTVRATLEWDITRPEHKWKAGLAVEKEKDLLKKWKKVSHQ